MTIFRSLPSLALIFSLALAAPLALAHGDKHSPAVSSETVKKTQEKLKEQGFYEGSVDGIIGPQTRSALWRYQKENNLRTDGHLTRETADRLGIVSTSEADKDPADHFEEAGEEVKDHYAAGAKAMGRGGKKLGEHVKEGEVAEGAEAFGKGAGKFGKEVGKGTGRAAKRVGKGIKDVFDGDDDKKKTKPRN